MDTRQSLAAWGPLASWEPWVSRYLVAVPESHQGSEHHLCTRAWGYGELGTKSFVLRVAVWSLRGCLPPSPVLLSRTPTLSPSLSFPFPFSSTVEAAVLIKNRINTRR